MLNKLKLNAGYDLAIPVGHFAVQLTLCAIFQRTRQSLKNTAHGRNDPHRHGRRIVKCVVGSARTAAGRQQTHNARQ